MNILICNQLNTPVGCKDALYTLPPNWGFQSGGCTHEQTITPYQFSVSITVCTAAYAGENRVDWPENGCVDLTIGVGLFHAELSSSSSCQSTSIFFIRLSAAWRRSRVTFTPSPSTKGVSGICWLDRRSSLERRSVFERV